MGYSDEKSAVKGPGYVAQDSSVHDLEEGTNEPEQLKRNMGARHINMIAIAGMIVSHHFGYQKLANCEAGNWSILELRKNHRQSWSSWCTLGVYIHGIDHCRSFLHHW